MREAKGPEWEGRLYTAFPDSEALTKAAAVLPSSEAFRGCAQDPDWDCAVLRSGCPHRRRRVTHGRPRGRQLSPDLSTQTNAR